MDAEKDELLLQTSREAEGVYLRYTLTEHFGSEGRLYSLKIEERSSKKRGAVELTDLTDRFEEAERLFRLFSDGLVTVATAEDILIDLFYAY